MSVDTMIRTITADTGETITVPVLEADDRTGGGYDWLETLEGTGWVGLPNWGSEGWDAGAWPLIILTVARTRDGGGELFGYGTYVEGDTASYWFRSQSACCEAITAEVFFHWNMGQADGPADLPATAGELPDKDRKPYPAGTQ